MATYTTQNPNKVERLVLYAPGWIRQTPSLTGPQAGAGPLGAYRTVTREMAMQRWMTGVPEDKKATLIPAGWFDAWANATWATDPVGAKTNPPVIRAPNGVLADSNDYWSAGKAYYDPAKITVPALLVQAEWDRLTALHGADALPTARQLARQALRDTARGHPHDHHGEEPPHAIRDSPGLPR
jgi:pimeloyl-ACP methyl ester carboxylesterase